MTEGLKKGRGWSLRGLATLGRKKETREKKKKKKKEEGKEREK